MKLKKMGALSLALAMTVTAMTGCAMPSTGGSDTTAAPTQEKTEASSKDSSSDTTAAESDEKITLRIVDWSDSSLVRREEFNKKYMEDHPNITIEYTMLTIDQFKNTIVTMIKSGDGPDLFPIPTGMTLSTALKKSGISQ